MKEDEIDGTECREKGRIAEHVTNRQGGKEDDKRKNIQREREREEWKGSY